MPPEDPSADPVALAGASPLRASLRRRALATALLVVGALAVRGRVAPLGPPPLVLPVGNAKVSATVTDAATGKPIAGARVRVFLPHGGWRAVAEAPSGADGVAVVPVPQDAPGAQGGEAWILVDAPGFARAAFARVLVVPATIAIAASLAPEKRARVTVVDEAGAPVPGAAVYAEVRGALCGGFARGDADPEGPAPTEAGCVLPVPVGAVTDDRGVADVRGIGADRGVLVARAPGWDLARSPAIAFGTTDAPASLTLTLRRLSAFVVTVLGVDGRPAAGAQVAVDSATLGPARVALTDKEGRVRIAGLAPGLFTLRAVLGMAVSPVAVAEELRKGEERPLVLTLAPGRVAVVRVLDGEEDGAPPLAGARVTLVEGGLSPFPIPATTGRDGVASVGPFLGAEASVTVEADGRVPRFAEALPASGPLEIHLVRAALLTVRVVDGRGWPVSGAHLEVVGFDGRGMPFAVDPGRNRFRASQFAEEARPRPFVAVGELGVVPGPVPFVRPSGGPSLGAGAAASAEPTGPSWVTGGDGRVEDAAVPPGRLRVVVRHPEYVPTTSPPIELASAARGEITVTVSRGGALEGIVEDDRGRPVAGAEVTLTAKDGTQERVALSGTDGSFAFAAVGAEAYVAVTAPDEPGTPALRELVAVPDGQVRKLRLTLPGAREPLQVRVTDDRGYPLDGAEIVLASLDPKVPLRRSVFTDKRGEAAARGFAGLPARLEVFAVDHAPYVEVLDGKKTELRVPLGLAEAAAVTVRDRRGAPIVGAEVTLALEAVTRREVTDRDGDATFRGLAPGKGQLRVRAAGYAPRELAVTVDAQGGRRPTTFPRVELSPGGEVTGEVRDPSGRPVAGARVAVGHVPVYLPSGPNPPGLTSTDSSGRFRLVDVPPGVTRLEAYAPERGRGRSAEFSIAAGQTVTAVVIPLAREEGGTEDVASGVGGVAVTLGETAAAEVLVAAVAPGSEAERAGIQVGDEIVRVDGVAVTGMADARRRLAGPAGVDVLVGLLRGDVPRTVRLPRQPLRK